MAHIISDGGEAVLLHFLDLPSCTEGLEFPGGSEAAGPPSAPPCLCLQVASLALAGAWQKQSLA